MENIIVGLDLGVSSIGWAVIKEGEGGKEILGLGSRIVPLSTDDSNEFSSGNAISKNANRTLKRTQRKGYDRYQQRRRKLLHFLKKFSMTPDEDLMRLPPLKLWELRSQGVEAKLSSNELGRVLYHLNQKRGYNSSRKEEQSADKKETAYVEEVKNRHQTLRESGLTIGQNFYLALKLAHENGGVYRIKQQVYPRLAYVEEFNAIIQEQRKHHPFLNDNTINELRTEIIYMQRPLKSQKGMVSICEFEGQYRKNAKGTEVFTGPRVAPRSSPIAQAVKIWESINNLRFTNKKGEIFPISPEQKQSLFEKLNISVRVTQKEVFSILNIKDSDGWRGNKQTEKGIQGNLTYAEIAAKILERKDLLAFDLPIESVEGDAHLIDRETGELVTSVPKRIIHADFEKAPLYRLWHTIYSIQDPEACTNALINQFGLLDEQAKELSCIDFTKSGFSNKSAKAIRKILPYLIDGYGYSDAMSFAGYNHSASLTKDEALKRQLKESLPLLKKNSLRQPVVEKILNQMIGVMNAIILQWGRPDEIRVELARELKQSVDERNRTFASLNQRERESDLIRKAIAEEYSKFGIRATRNTIIKWRLFHEICNDESKVNATCVYCGQPFGISDALLGRSVDVEHIIPKAKLFDDSQSNKTLVHRRCNEDKKDSTAFDFMSAKGEKALGIYIETVDRLYLKKVIGKRKRDLLLTSEKNIPKDFIERQLRETQYIARKAKEILEQVCYQVWSTSGSVTEYLRRIWGWNDALMNLQLPAYRLAGLTEWREFSDGVGNTQKKEVIKDWSKRDDHRHHAIDALVIACTKQGYVQRINTLNSAKTRNEMRASLNGGFDPKKNLLENYIFAQRPFSTKEVEREAEKVLISFKPGKRVATTSRFKAKGKNKESGVIVPRGPLSEESVYGIIKSTEKKKPLKYLFEHPELIFKDYIRNLVEDRIRTFEGDYKRALASLKKEPVFLDKEKTKVLEWATCFKSQIVIKYPLESIKEKDLEYIVDEGVRFIIRDRLTEFGGNPKKAFELPLYSDAAGTQRIRSVRCFTGLDSVVPIRKNENGEDISFVKPGNNHHLAFYTDAEGRKQEHVCTFWHAVERKKWNIPVIIQNPKEVWDHILKHPESFPQDFLEKLPADEWKFEISLQQNEMFLLGVSNETFQEAIKRNDIPLISKHLYRVQNLTRSDYFLRHHLETQIINTECSRIAKRYFRFKSIGALFLNNPIKVCISKTGQILQS